jgi:hypothetical protein
MIYEGGAHYTLDASATLYETFVWCRHNCLGLTHVKVRWGYLHDQFSCLVVSRHFVRSHTRLHHTCPKSSKCGTAWFRDHHNV